MRYNSQLILAALLLLPYTLVYGQDISGVWVGDYGKEKLASTYGLKFNIELVTDSTIKGTRTQFYSDGDYERFTIAGSYNKNDSTIYIIEKEPIEQTADGFGDAGSYKMKLDIANNTMTFRGKWRNNSTGLFTMGTSNVWVKKKLKNIPAEKPKKQIDNATLYKIHPKQQIKIIETINITDVEKDSIRIEITDNYKVDGDIISLYINNDCVLHNKKISYTPLTHNIYLDRNMPECNIIMEAKSYGSIPPCTAQIKVITTKETHVKDIESNYGRSEGITIQLLENKAY